MGLAKHLTGLELDAAYEYVNWYLSGWAGAYLNRQGYYSAVLETAKQNMSADEWGYWMDGKPAAGDIVSPDGKVIDKAGRQARRRFVLRTHEQGCLLEFGHGPGPLHGSEME